MFQDLKFPCFALVLCVLCEESSQELLVRSTKNSTRLTSSSAAAWLASPRSQIPLLRYYSVLLSRSSLLIIVPALPVASLARSLTLSVRGWPFCFYPAFATNQPTNTTTKPVMLLVLMLSSVRCLARRPFSSSSTHTLVRFALLPEPGLLLCVFLLLLLVARDLCWSPCAHTTAVSGDLCTPTRLSTLQQDRTAPVLPRFLLEAVAPSSPSAS